MRRTKVVLLVISIAVTILLASFSIKVNAESSTIGSNSIFNVTLLLYSHSPVFVEGLVDPCLNSSILVNVIALNPGENISIIYNNKLIGSYICNDIFCSYNVTFVPSYDPDYIIVGIGNLTYRVSLRYASTVLSNVSFDVKDGELIVQGNAFYNDTSRAAICDVIYLFRESIIATSARPSKNGQFILNDYIPLGTTLYCVKPEHGYQEVCHNVTYSVAINVSIPKYNLTSPSLGSPQSLYVALVSAVIYLYFATRWNNPFLALIPFGLIIYGYGAVTRSGFLITLGGAALIAGALINYLRGRGS